MDIAVKELELDGLTTLYHIRRITVDLTMAANGAAAETGSTLGSD